MITLRVLNTSLTFRYLERKTNFRCHAYKVGKTGLDCGSENKVSYSKRNIVKPIEMVFTAYDSAKVDPKQSKAPVIIMHGLLGSRTNWKSLSKVMHSKTMRKIIAVDARNHGDSPHSPEFTYSHLAEDVRALMENLNIPKASLIGHSMGGRTMMLMALKYPSFVEKLVVVDISPVGISPSLSVTKSYIDAMKSVKLDKNIPFSSARKSVDEQLKKAVPDSMLRSFLVTNLVEDNGDFKWRVNLDAISQNFFSHVADFPVTESQSKCFQSPTLFIGGGKSDFLRPEEHTQIKHYFPEAEFVYIPDAGHWVHSEKPNEFIGLVCNFLNRTSV